MKKNIVTTQSQNYIQVAVKTNTKQNKSIMIERKDTCIKKNHMVTEIKVQNMRTEIWKLQGEENERVQIPLTYQRNNQYDLFLHVGNWKNIFSVSFFFIFIEI